MKIDSPKVVMLTLAVTAALGGCAGYNQAMSGAPALMAGQRLALQGANEVPAVTTSGTATAVVLINSDRSVSGELTTSGFVPTAAHIHEGAAGANGPVIVPMVKDSENKFVFPAGAKLTDAQYDAYKAGKLYINVHSAAHPGGELRAQINP